MQKESQDRPDGAQGDNELRYGGRYHVLKARRSASVKKWFGLAWRSTVQGVAGTRSGMQAVQVKDRSASDGGEVAKMPQGGHVGTSMDGGSGSPLLEWAVAESGLASGRGWSRDVSSCQLRLSSARVRGTGTGRGAASCTYLVRVRIRGHERSIPDLGSGSTVLVDSFKTVHDSQHLDTRFHQSNRPSSSVDRRA
jgi:hypothetical protein